MRHGTRRPHDSGRIFAMALFKRGAAPTSPSSSSAQDSAGSGNGAQPEYTIDELARAAGTTVRNVRSYQDRGLIDPPERRGRVGIYTQAHLGRLRLINHLLARGYTLANIMELLKAIVEGHDLRSILGLETAISSPWNSEAPRHY